jgi:2-octaprenyl-6-methoxyphenol hydroxylase
MTAVRTDYDIIVAGAGMVGSCLALALARLPVRILVVDPMAPMGAVLPDGMPERRPGQEARERPAGVPGESNFDARVTALANGSQRIFQALDLWSALEPHVQPINTIHVSNRGSFGIARIRASEEGVAALGYTIENQHLQRVLLADRSRWPDAQWHHATRVTDVYRHDDRVEVTLSDDAGSAVVTARLLVAADGSRSSLRAALGATVTEHDYGQTAIVANCTTQVSHGGVAYERFTATGALAMLPLPGGRSGLIWTLPSAESAQLVDCSDEAFKRALQTVFGQRLGRFERLGQRQTYPLVASSARPIAAERLLLIGNAANTLHPVAGQGFNLALRDVSILAEIIAQQSGDAADPGCSTVLDAYQKWRRSDQNKVSWFTHNLISLFGNDRPDLSLGRNLGLVFLDLIPGAKAMLAKHTMGLAGRLPRLARGVGLDERGPRL